MVEKFEPAARAWIPAAIVHQRVWGRVGLAESFRVGRPFLVIANREQHSNGGGGELVQRESRGHALIRPRQNLRLKSCLDLRAQHLAVLAVAPGINTARDIDRQILTHVNTVIITCPSSERLLFSLVLYLRLTYVGIPHDRTQETTTV